MSNPDRPGGDLMGATDIDILFRYHPPNERTAPLYTAIREAEARLRAVLDALPTSFAQDEAECLTDVQVSSPIYYQQVNDAAVWFYACLVLPGWGTAYPVVATHLIALDVVARASIALARNAANEAIATRQDVGRLLALARTEAQKARWAMCGIVAIVDAATPPTKESP